MAASPTDTFWAAATPQSKAQRVEIRYFRMPPQYLFEHSRYAVAVNGIMVGEVSRGDRRAMWGADSALDLPAPNANDPSATTRRIPARHDRRREAAISLIERNLYAHPHLAAAAGIV